MDRPQQIPTPQTIPVTQISQRVQIENVTNGRFSQCDGFEFDNGQVE